MSKPRDQAVIEHFVPPREAQADDALVRGYRIEHELESPASPGLEYEATEIATGARVVLKLLPEHLSQDPAFRVRFRRDTRILATIEHDHLLTLDGGQWGYDLFVVTRPVRGRTLRELIASGGLDETKAIQALEPVASALDAAHAKGLLHRGITPDSIIVDTHGSGFLADIGLTPVDISQLLAAGEFTGTLNYTAPERIRGEPDTREGDIYSLAAVLHECLIGEPPATDAAPSLTAGGDPEPAVEQPGDAWPATVEDVLRRALAADQATRPPAAGELIGDAKRALERAPSKNKRGVLRRTVQRQPTTVRRRRRLPSLRRERHATRPSRPRTRMVHAVLAAAVLALAAVGGVFAAGDGSSTRRASPAAVQLHSLNAVIGKLNDERSAGRRRLMQSKTPNEQAVRAAELARAYGAAIQTLGSPASSGGQSAASAPVAAALTRARAAYLRLSSTARRGDRVGYDQGRRAVVESEAALGGSLARFAT